MTDKEIEIADIIFDAIEEGNALNIETKRTTYEDCAVLSTHEDHFVITTYDVVKGSEREFDIQWDDVIKVDYF